MKLPRFDIDWRTAPEMAWRAVALPGRPGDPGHRHHPLERLAGRPRMAEHRRRLSAGRSHADRRQGPRLRPPGSGARLRTGARGPDHRAGGRRRLSRPGGPGRGRRRRRRGPGRGAEGPAGAAGGQCPGGQGGGRSHGRRPGPEPPRPGAPGTTAGHRLVFHRDQREAAHRPRPVRRPARPEPGAGAGRRPPSSACSPPSRPRPRPPSPPSAPACSWPGSTSPTPESWRPRTG